MDSGIEGENVTVTDARSFQIITEITSVQVRSQAEVYKILLSRIAGDVRSTAAAVQT